MVAKYEPGDRVMILEDCREGSTATGQQGTYEGAFPHYVLAQVRGKSYETKLDNWICWLAVNVPSGEKKLNDVSWSLHKDPRIRLDDGSLIWGTECWWAPIEKVPHLEEAQAQLEECKRGLRKVILATEVNDAEDED